MFETVPEQRPVGQSAERVVEGLVFQLLLEPLAFRYVTQREDNAFNRRVPEQVVGHDLYVAPTPVTVTDAPLCGDRRPGPEGHAAISGDRRFHVVGVQQRRQLHVLQRPAHSQGCAASKESGR